MKLENQLETILSNIILNRTLHGVCDSVTIYLYLYEEAFVRLRTAIEKEEKQASFRINWRKTKKQITCVMGLDLEKHRYGQARSSNDEAARQVHNGKITRGLELTQVS